MIDVALPRPNEAETETAAPLTIFDSALRLASEGGDGVMHLVDATGGRVGRIDPSNWTNAQRRGDDSLLRRCAGPTLDIGCGPGRLSAALARAGHPALGIDISAEAVRQAQRRGAAAIRRDVFQPLPGEARWRHILLADGNIGIGGDPTALLTRANQLLDPCGTVLVEVVAPGVGSWSGRVRIVHAGRRSTPFPWAMVSVDAIAALATRAGLYVLETWTEGRRWFAHLAR